MEAVNELRKIGVLVFHSCITDYQKFMGLKTTPVYWLPVLYVTYGLGSLGFPQELRFRLGALEKNLLTSSFPAVS